MSLSFTVVPGETWPTGTKVTLPRLRKTAKPSIIASGTISAADISNNDVDIIKLKSQPIMWATGDNAANDTIEVSVDNTPTSLADGLAIRFRAKSAKTSAATLKLNQLTTKKLLRADGTAIQVGDIKFGQLIETVYASWADSGTGAWLYMGDAQDTGAFYASSVSFAGNNWDLTLSPGPTVAAGTTVAFLAPGNTSHGATPTVSLNSGTQFTVKRLNQVDLKGGEILPNQVVTLIHDGSYWQMQSPAATVDYAADGGSSQSYVVTVPGITALTSGLSVQFRPNTTNTDSGATLNVNSLGAKSLKRSDGSSVAAGDIQSGQWYWVTYDGTNWRLDSIIRRFVLSGQTVSGIAKGEVVYSHGFSGRVPDRFGLYLKCETPELGYAAGCKVELATVGINSGTETACYPFADATNIGFACHVAASSWQLPHRSSGNMTDITETSWVIVGYAEIVI